MDELGDLEAPFPGPVEELMEAAGPRATRLDRIKLRERLAEARAAYERTRDKR